MKDRKIGKWEPPLKILLLAALITLALLSTFIPATTWAQTAKSEKGSPVKYRKLERNRYAPELYADKLRMRINLVDLPGADSPGSDCEVSYRLYFIAEEEFWRVLTAGNNGMRGLPEIASFTGKILLAEGRFKTSRLSSLKDRTYVRDHIAFKSKVPDQARTKFATLLTVYSAKINDGRLNKMVFGSGSFITEPFDDNPSRPEEAIARTDIYLNFFVSPKGELYESQLPQDENKTSW